MDAVEARSQDMKPLRAARVSSVSIDLVMEDIRIRHRATISCGCTMYIGRHIGDDSVQFVAQACCQPHLRITDRAVELFNGVAELDDESLFLATAAEVLAEASHEVRPATVED